MNTSYNIPVVYTFKKELPDINKLGWKAGDELEWDNTTVLMDNGEYDSYYIKNKTLELKDGETV
jgi:hypothetical protein